MSLFFQKKKINLTYFQIYFFFNRIFNINYFLNKLFDFNFNFNLFFCLNFKIDYRYIVRGNII